MAKKITLTNVKSFVAKNLAQLHIAVLSKFDGMTDCVSSTGDHTFRPVKAPDLTGHPFRNSSQERDPRMGIAGAWFVYSSRDHFREYSEGGFTGIEVSNCCGRFVLAIPAPLAEVLAPAPEAAPVIKVQIVDADKAGLINGPFWVVVIKAGKMIASHTGIQGPTGAAGVAKNLCAAYQAVMA